MREFLVAARERDQPLPTNFMAILLQALCRLAKVRIYTIRDDFENVAIHELRFFAIAVMGEVARGRGFQSANSGVISPGRRPGIPDPLRC